MEKRHVDNQKNQPLEIIKKLGSDKNPKILTQTEVHLNDQKNAVSEVMQGVSPTVKELRDAAEAVSGSISMLDRGNNKKLISRDTMQRINATSQRLIELLGLEAPATLKGLDRLDAVLTEVKNLENSYLNTTVIENKKGIEQLSLTLLGIEADISDKIF